jgi:hypothetical protein
LLVAQVVQPVHTVMEITLDQRHAFHVPLADILQ